MNDINASHHCTCRTLCARADINIYRYIDIYCEILPASAGGVWSLEDFWPQKLFARPKGTSLALDDLLDAVSLEPSVPDATDAYRARQSA